ncbi:MAG: cyanophycin synthetase [Armatimonadetes bacterium]|nr:cyanophycin synthetase [Armatimonadota bacterium]
MALNAQTRSPRNFERGLDIRKIRTYHGPNLWAYKPLIHMILDLGEFEQFPSDSLEGFTDRLVGMVPTLEEHKCSVGRAGGFIQRLQEGTWMGHIVEHVALELQCLAGNMVKFGKTRSTDEVGVYNVVYEFLEESVGIEAGRVAVELCQALAEGRDYPLREKQIRLAEMVEELAYGPSTMSILVEARKRTIPVIRLNEANLVQLGYGRYQQRIQATTTSLTRMIAVDIACDKNLTKKLLSDIGIPVPGGALLQEKEAAVAEAETIGYPVVVKPLDYSHGRGISLNLQNREQLEIAFDNAQRFTRGVIVEKFLSGRDFRILVVNGEVIAVAERVPAHVTGNGRDSVTKLIEDTNADPRRGVGHEKVLTQIKVDDHTRRLLGEQGLSMESVPAEGRMVLLKATANISTGGTAIDRTDVIHFSNIEMAQRAARVIGLDIAGIDVICEDISRPIWETGGAIIEVNAAPGFRMHVAPSEGKPRDVAGPVVDMLFPPLSRFRVPIASITGTNGKTTTARMCAHILKMNGHKVGLTTTDGIYIDGSLIRKGDMTGPWSARMVLKDPGIDFAVLETARGGILRAGLGFDRCDVGAVLNVSDDHLGLGGVNTLDELAHVKSLIVEVVKPGGWGVLNAQDERCVAMASKCDGKLAYFSLDSNNALLAEHLETGGLGATCEHGTIIIRDGPKRIPVVDCVDIPATYGGMAEANVKNALAATLICHVSGVGLDDIRQGLKTFDASYHLTPGRLNLMDIRDFRVLMDYAHNIAAFEEMARFVGAFYKNRCIGVVTAPGDRQDRNLEIMGEIAGRTFDVVVFKEDDDRRGRAPGEIAGLMAAGARQARGSDENVHVVLTEPEAVQRGLEMARRDDLVVILADDLTRTWDQVTKFRQSLIGH